MQMLQMFIYGLREVDVCPKKSKLCYTIRDQVLAGYP